jgi:hypothetical protein
VTSIFAFKAVREATGIGFVVTNADDGAVERAAAIRREKYFIVLDNNYVESEGKLVLEIEETDFLSRHCVGSGVGPL